MSTVVSWPARPRSAKANTRRMASLSATTLSRLQRARSAAQGLHLALEAMVFQSLVHRQFEHLDLQRLDQVVVSPGAQGRDHRGRVLVGGHHDHRHLRVPGADARQCGDAVHARQARRAAPGPRACARAGPRASSPLPATRGWWRSRRMAVRLFCRSRSSSTISIRSRCMGRLRSGPGKSDEETGTAAGLADHLHGGVVLFEDLVDNGHPCPRPWWCRRG